MFIKCPIQIASELIPTAIFIVEKNKKITFKEAHHLCCLIQTNIKKLGLKKHDRVALDTRLLVPFILYFWACLREGFVVYPINYKLPKDVRRKHLIFLKATFIDAYIPNLVEQPCSIQRLHLKAITNIITTSGSSGEPKFVEHRLENHYFSYMGIKTPLKVSSKTRWLLNLPVYHISGLSILFRMIFSSGSIVISDDLDWNLNQSTHASFVPTQIQDLMDQKKECLLLHMKVVLIGGSVMSECVKQALIRANVSAFVCYGLTESTSLITLGNIEEYPNVGRVLPFRCLTFKNEDLFFKGKILFNGYVDDDGFTRLELDEDDRFNTGDLGLIKDNKIFVNARKGAMIISGGENIYLNEIEFELLKHPSVKQCVVVGADHKRFGKVAHAYVDTTKKMDQSMIDEFNDFLKKTLPNYKCPKSFFSYSKLKISSGIMDGTHGILGGFHQKMKLKEDLFR